MNTIKTIRVYMLIVLMMACGFKASAQPEPITVEAELSRLRVYVGDDLTYQVLVRGTNNPSEPVVDFPPSVRAVYNGRSSQSFTTMRSVNGRRKMVTDQRYSYQYTLTALDSGQVVIPAPIVEINGQSFVGNKTSFESLFPAVSDTDQLTMVLDRDEIYLNETVVVQIEWWIGAQTSDFSFNSSNIPNSFRITGYEPKLNVGQRVPFEINGQQMLGVASVDRNDPQQRTKLSFQFGITPTQTGAFDLGPIRAIFTRHSGTGSNFKAYVESAPMSITVLDVPAENKPNGYAGAIGAFQLEASASKTTVNVGDPIRLTLRISADEPMVGIDDGPDLASDERFADRFKVSSEGWREKLPRQSGQRVYETTIRALDEHVTQVPPIRLYSFHPASRSYRTYQSNPIELVVNPVQEITLSDAIVTGSGGTLDAPSKQPEQIELTRAMPGLWAHSDSESILEKRSFSLTKALKEPVWIATIASGPTIFTCTLILIGVRRNSNPRARALNKAWHQSGSMLRQGQHAKALRRYLSAALEMNEDSVVAQDAYRLPIKEEDASLISQLLADDEHAAYFGQEPFAASGEATRNGLLKDVHKQMLRSWRNES
jgi:oxygen tolerance protein BatD